jgi:hypothetical protein
MLAEAFFQRRENGPFQGGELVIYLPGEETRAGAAAAGTFLAIVVSL